ncbi:aminotransferase class V-fold PLP-dependent enzyme [Bradyrhizobium sp. CCGUVB1N3]|uniref:aminotransferase class V-fold PLP-dependent enzyme n=1 Tax=Bradyrhizobium sp. CCGUVB1N3 TaxID=2949629 RepID=UPI0020B1DD4A|nr:aminotransferase class V-fold PLP-dependent enzyme [Bradyrhizobium sp. CCGUVB1N3]MCP3475949.1 aminotransferase class V-fold PLP-dependent enzyme [Bradyrhizobium sp. CCGUVB1N3]
MIDIDKVRADTPACEQVLHFNNAGASLMPRQVYEAVKGVLDLENGVGGYEAERRLADDLQAFYSEFAALLNARPDEIAFVENATRAWDMAFYALPLQSGDRVITHGSEYASNFLAFLHQAKRRGIEIDIAPSDESGQLDVAALETLIRPATKLIAITHVPTQGGLVNPAAAVGQVAKKHNILYLLDACQSVGQLEVDVKAIGCDILSGTGRKFLRGPRGTGFLYVSNAIVEKLDPPFIDLLSANWTTNDQYELAAGAKRFENWESYVGGRVGLMTAVRYARSIGIAVIEQRVSSLAATLRDALCGETGVSVHDLGRTKCGIVTFQKQGLEPQNIAERLRAQQINVSVSGVPYARLDLGGRGLSSLVRASVHYFNTEKEIERFVEIVSSLIPT